MEERRIGERGGSKGGRVEAAKRREDGDGP